MTFSSSLDDRATPLILDTSVLINLHASMRGPRMLEALPNEIFVPKLVAWELEHETSRENGEHQFFRSLVAEGTVRLIELCSHEYEVFEKIVSGSTSLGDGEAATIAIAASRGQLAVIDDQRGRARGQSFMPSKDIVWPLDLFLHPIVRTALGPSDCVEALYLALRDGRMRVHEDRCNQVLDIIGVRRALDCKSLPGYKQRKNVWQKLAAEIERL